MKTKISGGEFLVGRKIIEVGVTNRNNGYINGYIIGYIKLDDGKTLYLDSSELEEVESMGISIMRMKQSNTKFFFRVRNNKVYIQDFKSEEEAKKCVKQLKQGKYVSD